MPSVIVVGASRGIGLEFVRQYLADGWRVEASARKDEDLDELRRLGATPHRADVTDEASLAAMADAIGETVDVLILNAGLGSHERLLADVKTDEWTRVMTVNALGPLIAARTLGEKVRQAGKIAALSSWMGSISENGGGAWSYRMSKAALNMGLSCLAIELKPRDVAVVSLHPGWVKTDMGGEQAPLSPQDSVTGMRTVIDRLSLQDTGSFHDYSGKRLPW